MLHYITEIKETTEIQVVNKLLDEGWQLLTFYKPSDGRIVYVLGKVKNCAS